MADSLNYPDLLGSVTGGARLNVGAAQVALAMRPTPVRAGQTFELVLIAQSVVDVDVDLTVQVHLPDVDARRQRGRLTAKTTRLVVGMKPGEAGYVMIPVTPLPDIHPSHNYRISVDVEAKATAKGGRVRDPEGGGAVEPRFLPAATLEKMASLRPLKFVTGKRNTLEVMFEIVPPKLNQGVEDTKAGWVSLLKIGDYKDPRLALRKYTDVISVQLLPRLKRNEMYAPLIAATAERFANAGYPLRESEGKLIARLMALILEYADSKDSAHGYVAAGRFSIKPLITKDPMTAETEVKLPRWFEGMIQQISIDERAAAFPARVIPKVLYPELLYDAILYGFELVATATGEDFGTAQEKHEYAEQNIGFLAQKGKLDFSRVYLPLIMGAILINDKMLMDKEDPSALLRQEGSIIEERVFEISEDDMPIYHMTNQVIMQVGQRYGFYK